MRIEMNVETFSNSLNAAQRRGQSLKRVTKLAHPGLATKRAMDGPARTARGHEERGNCLGDGEVPRGTVRRLRGTPRPCGWHRASRGCRGTARMAPWLRGAPLPEGMENHSPLGTYRKEGSASF